MPAYGSVPITNCAIWPLASMLIESVAISPRLPAGLKMTAVYRDGHGSEWVKVFKTTA